MFLLVIAIISNYYKNTRYYHIVVPSFRKEKLDKKDGKRSMKY